MNIVVADDDRTVVHLVASLLREKCHRVVPVFDAMQAFMFAMRRPTPDVLILDINMPGGTGLETLKRLRASQNTALMPVIVLTGATDVAILDEVKSLGVQMLLENDWTRSDCSRLSPVSRQGP